MRLSSERVVAAFAAGPPTRAAWVERPPSTRGRVGLLPGSFNPPTDAHVALARSARANGLDCVVYVLSNNTVNKAAVTGIPLADRLDLLRDLARADGNGVIFTNRGLYVDIARDVRPLIDGDLVFLVGHDKIGQILDRRYYGGRSDALDDLFSHAEIAAAPRDAATEGDLDTLMSNPENLPYRGRVSTLPLDAEFRVMSSTAVREGRDNSVPAIVAAYVARNRPFRAGGEPR